MTIVQRRIEPSSAPIAVGNAPATHSGYPSVRLRRNRKADWTRRIVAENRLSTSDLIWPIFLIDGSERRVPVAHMPGVDRVNIDEAVAEAEKAMALGIPAIAPFPNIDRALRDPVGSEAVKANNLMCRAVTAIKKALPQLGIVTDAALDPYTSHGHDGVLDATGRILNDDTIEILCRQSLALAEAGTDCIAPSTVQRISAEKSAVAELTSREQPLANDRHAVVIIAGPDHFRARYHGPPATRRECLVAAVCKIERLQHGFAAQRLVAVPEIVELYLAWGATLRPALE